MDYKDYAALELVLEHTRDPIFKKQTLELEKLQRKFNRLNNSHQGLIKYTCLHEPNGYPPDDPPNHCEGCGQWNYKYGSPWLGEMCLFLKFYSDLLSIDDDDPHRRTWVLEMVYVCDDCIMRTHDAELCTKYKLSYWLSFADEPIQILQQLVDIDKDFCRTTANNWTRKFQFSYAVDNDYVKDKMHHIAAYMIQRAFRCGWDYRRAFED